MNLPIENLSAESFRPFGAVVEQPKWANDASGPGWQWWGELIQMKGGDRPYAIGYLDLKPAALSFNWAERHMLSDELLVPLGGDCLVYVGPADYPDEPMHISAFERWRVFKVRQGQAVLLKPGVWHGAPLAADKPLNVLVILLNNTAKQDLHVVRFEDAPIEITR